MAPTDNDIAVGGLTAAISEIPALELDSHSLPFVRSGLPLRLAIGVSGLYGFHQVSEFHCEHAEQKHRALFIDWLMARTAKINGVAVSWSVLQLGVPNRGRGCRKGSAILRHFSSCYRRCLGLRPGQQCNYICP